jgi:hypothetical protein
MKRVAFILILISLGLSAFSQKAVVNEYAAVDKKALQAPDSATTSTAGIARYMTATFPVAKDRVRGIFIWIASSIQYDLQNMFAINLYEKKEEKISRALKTRKGICENYAALFEDICSQSGIKAVVVEGFTKQNGFTDYIPHAWCAAQIDSSWYMFDPTWGSGYVNGGKFYKRINNAYYKASPSVLIRSHMPFDYLWQMLEYPVTVQEFYDGKTQVNKSKPYFNYADSIIAYEKLDHVAQLKATAIRIERNGLKNAMVFDRLQHIKVELENDRIKKENERQNQLVYLYNSAGNAYNEAVNKYNEFVNYKNKQFMPSRPDSEIQGIMDDAHSEVKKARARMSKISNPNADMTNSIAHMNKSIDELNKNIEEQQNWLNTYFSKSKSKRRGMFYEKKITWFGVPLN